jgi:hypothetical protein
MGEPCPDRGESPGRCKEVGDFYVLVHDYNADDPEATYGY